ncbi:MAG: hypothetical protein VYC17_04480 [Nitrospinota bacterium]|nr:hypothetical protein [Nitrospinota bacterium]
MKLYIPLKKIFLGGLFFLAMLSKSVPSTAHSSGLLERAFFYNDIYHFVGNPFPAPAMDSTKNITQPFRSECSNLNRIILPFYVLDGHEDGRLTFSLFEMGNEEEPVFSTSIDTSGFPSPKNIGSHTLRGVLFYVWIPPQINSRNADYFWVLRPETGKTSKGIGLYFTRHKNSQLQPVRVDGRVQEKQYAAFYSYCNYAFEWKAIFQETGQRLAREKLFLGFFLMLICGVAVYFKKAEGS